MAIAPTASFANSLNNGDFQTGDFTGWTQDIDGLPPALELNDFSIAQPTAGNFVARIETDYWSTQGDTSSIPLDEVFFANTLYQALNLNSPSGQRLQLSFDWTFSGERSDFDENFIIGLANENGDYFDATGELGYLLNPTAYGSGTYTTTLDSLYINSLGWNVEFQLNSGFDGFGSNFTIDTVKLNPVPIPAAFWLFGSALIGLAHYCRKNGKC